MKLKFLREQSGLSQTEFAKKFNISQNTYSNYEIGKTQPDLELLKQFADYYNVSMDYIIDRPFRNNIGYMTDEQLESIKLILSLDEKKQNKVFGYAESLKENK